MVIGEVKAIIDISRDIINLMKENEGFFSRIFGHSYPNMDDANKAAALIASPEFAAKLDGIRGRPTSILSLEIKEAMRPMAMYFLWLKSVKNAKKLRDFRDLVLKNDDVKRWVVRTIQEVIEADGFDWAYDGRRE